MSKMALEVYTLIIENAAPYAVTFGFCNLIVRTFIRAAFGGKLEV